jgi:hypothetical protein
MPEIMLEFGEEILVQVVVFFFFAFEISSFSDISVWCCR